MVKRNGGVSIVELLVVLGLSGTVIAMIISAITIMIKGQTQSNITFQADTLRRSITSALNNDNSWKFTVTSATNNRSNGPSLDCVPMGAPAPSQSGYPCTNNQADIAAGGAPLSNKLINMIYDAGGGVVYDASQPNFGVSQQGMKCTSFSSVSGQGNSACPLRFEVHWSAKCSSTCVNPQIQLQITAIFNPGNDIHIAFNPANYGTPLFFRGENAATTSCWVYQSGSLIDTCAGPVGIGTNVPLSTVAIGPGARTGLSSGQMNGLSVSLGSDSYLTASSSALTTFLGTDGGTANGAIGTFTSHPLSIRTNNTERMYLDTSGRIGINTNNPAGALHVKNTYPATQNVAYLENPLGPSVLTVLGTSSGNNWASTIDFMNGSTHTASIKTTASGRISFFNGTTESAVFENNGSFGIGTAYPQHRLDVNGDINASGCVGASGANVGGSCVSDRRLKEAIRPFDLGLEVLVGLQPKSFLYNGLGGHPRSKSREIGLIAQEVEAVAPELVNSIDRKLHASDLEKTAIKRVNYTPLIYIAINAIRELHNRFENSSEGQSAKIRELQKQVDESNSRVEQLLRRQAKLEERLEKLSALRDREN